MLRLTGLVSVGICLLLAADPASMTHISGQADANADSSCYTDTDTTEELSAEEIQDELMQGYEFDTLNDLVSEYGGDTEWSFEDMVSSLMQGDVEVEENGWKKYCYEIFLKELEANIGILVKLILLAVITAIFTNMSGTVGKGLISENGFYITYLIMTALLMSSFYLIYQVAEDTVTDLIQIMEALIPTYMMAVSFSSGVTSSAILQESMVLGISAVSWGIRKIVFPCIQLFVVLQLVNNLQEEDFFSKFGELIQTGVKWLLKSILAVVVGMNTIKSMLAPAADSVAAAALQRGLGAVPGGQALNAVSGVVIGSGILIKNAIGVGGMLLIAMAVTLPIIKMSVFILSYKFIAALLQPISDKRMIQGIQGISEGGQLLMTAVLTVIVLFLLSIAIVAVSTNVTYYAG